MAFRETYGWRHVDGEGPEGEPLYIEDEFEQEILRELHHKQKWGWALHDLAILMMARGIPSPNGEMWNDNTMRMLLRRCQPGVPPIIAQKKRKGKDVTVYIQPDATPSELTKLLKKTQFDVPKSGC